MATGAKHWVDLFEANMQSQSFWLPITKPDGQTGSQQLFGILEELKMYRYVIPQGAAPIVLKTLNFDAICTNSISSKSGNFPISDSILYAVRKALGLKKPDVFALTGTNELPNITLPVTKQYIRIIPVGIKEDETRVMTESGLKQEAI